MSKEKQWRCTRPDRYTDNCPGRTNPRARQGHYVTAETEREARLQMEKDFPTDSHFDIELWAD